MTPPTVVNVRHSSCDVYIGRSKDRRKGRWGNPYSHQEGTLAKFKVATREEAIRKYGEWIVTQPHLMAALPELAGKRLGCFCVPHLACHGEVLVELVSKLSDPENIKNTSLEYHSSLTIPRLPIYSTDIEFTKNEEQQKLNDNTMLPNPSKLLASIALLASALASTTQIFAEYLSSTGFDFVQGLQTSPVGLPPQTIPVGLQPNFAPAPTATVSTASSEVASAPESASETEEQATKRKRRTKAEMEEARRLEAEAAQAQASPELPLKTEVAAPAPTQEPVKAPAPAPTPAPAVTTGFVLKTQPELRAIINPLILKGRGNEAKACISKWCGGQGNLEVLSKMDAATQQGFIAEIESMIGGTGEAY